MADTNAQSALPSTGNSFLDALNSLVEIGSKGVGVYSTFLDKKTAAKVATAQANAVPSQVVTVPQTASQVNAETLRTLGAYGALLLFGIAGVLLVVKYTR